MQAGDPGSVCAMTSHESHHYSGLLALHSPLQDGEDDSELHFFKNGSRSWAFQALGNSYSLLEIMQSVP